MPEPVHALCEPDLDDTQSHLSSSKCFDILFLFFVSRTSGDDRIYINVRPLLKVSQPKEGQTWRHITQWPPVEGERNWDRRNVNHALWIMADQVSSLEWVFCLKIRNDRSDDQSLGRVLQQVIEDLALQPDSLLLPNPEQLGV